MKLGGFLKLLSGNVTAQIVSVLTLPLLAGLYGLEEFGTAYLVISIATILVAIGLLGLQQAIVVHKSEQLAFDTLVLSLGGLLATVLLFYFMTTRGVLESFSKGLVFKIFPAEIIATAVALGLMTLLMSLANRDRSYGAIAVSRISGAIAYAGAAIALGAMFGYLTSQLIFAFLFCQVITITCLVLPIVKLKRIRSNFHLTKQNIVANKKFLAFTYPTNILSAFTINLPNILIAAAYSAGKAGLFVLAFRIIQGPINLAGFALGQIFLKNFSELEITAAKKQVLLATGLMLRMLAGPLAIFVSLLSIIPRHSIGSDWGDALSIVIYFLPWMLLWFIAKPVAGVLMTTGRNSLALLGQVITIFFQILGITIGVLLESFNYSMIGLGVSGFASYLIYLGIIFRSMDVALAELFENLIDAWIAVLAFFLAYIFGLLGLTSGLTIGLIMALVMFDLIKLKQEWRNHVSI